MPKFRSVYTKIVQSFDFNEMPDDFTRLMWVLLPLGLDREGRGIFKASWIKSKIFPIRDDVSDKKIMSSMDFFVERGMVEVYEVDARVYFYVVKFKEYQRGFEKESPSDLPDPLQSNSRPTPELVKSNSPLNANAYMTSDENAEADANADARESAPAPLILNSFQTGNPFYIRVWSKVTGMAAIPGGDSAKVLNALDGLRQQHPDESELVTFLKKYFDDWLKRKTKDGRSYSRSNCAWIYDLAIAGEPTKDEIQNKPKPRADPNCPKCDGTGWMASGIDDIQDPKFGKMIQCDCVKVRT